ncbi:MAG: hypothetical protein EAX96_10455 [Candidatus Lokiarchaeota archaeon]|nr:hypothetical protein [Candidatus Lokiarchaeota archaeon]
MNEIPDEIYVSLGRRGFDPLKIKYCHVCNNPTVKDLELLEKKVVREQDDGNNFYVEIDYKIRDKKCNGTFFIKLKHVYSMLEGDKKRMTTKVHILDENKKDLGWLGNF